MEPVSISASLLTVLAAAGGTCQFLYNLILDISDAPSEIRSQADKLRCLQRCFSTLLQAYSQLPSDLQVEPDLQSKLVNFLHDVHIINTKVQAKCRGLDEHRMQRVWERCKWLASDRHLTKFYSSLEQWNTIFDQAASVVNLKILMRILQQTSSTVADTPPAICPERAMTNNSWEVNGPLKSHHVMKYMIKDSSSFQSTCNTHTNVPQPFDQLERYLSHLIDPIDLNVRRLCEIEWSSAAASIRAGNVVTRRWSTQGQVSYNVLSSKNGYSISFMVQSRRIKVRLSVTIFLVYQFAQWSDVSLRFQPRVSSLIAIDHPAYLSATGGDWLTLRRLLDKGHVAITDQTVNGDTLLHIAVSRNQIHLIKELLQQGADVNATNDQSETPLHVAIACMCDYEVSRSLISFGANMLHQDLGQKTPFHAYFHGTLRQIFEFHRDDIDRTITDSDGMTVSHYVAFTKQSNPIDLARSLGSQPSDICATDHEGRTILHLALRRGNLNLVEYLFEQGIEALEQPDHYGRCIMHYATESRRTQLIDLLHSRGHCIRARDKRGQSVLHHAASKGTLAAVKKLLELGAASDLDTLDLSSRTPIQVAALFGAYDVVEYLQKLCKPQILVYPGRAVKDSGSAVAGHGTFAATLMLVYAKKYLYCLLFLVGLLMGVLCALS